MNTKQKIFFVVMVVVAPWVMGYLTHWALQKYGTNAVVVVMGSFWAFQQVVKAAREVSKESKN